MCSYYSSIGDVHLGFEYNPHPQAYKLWTIILEKYKKNNDTRANAQFASFNG
jgi:hypothetical protein